MELGRCAARMDGVEGLFGAEACAGLKLMPDKEGISSHEYIRGHKSVIRSAKADLN